MPTFETTVKWRADTNDQLTVTQVSEFVWQVAFPTTTVDPVLYSVGGPQSVDDEPIEPR